MAVVVCGKCDRRMTHTRSGIHVVETHRNGKPYQVWSYDEYKCDNCDSLVYSGRGEGPIVKSFDKERLEEYTIEKSPNLPRFS